VCLDDVVFYEFERQVIDALVAGFPGRVMLKPHPSNRFAVDPLIQRFRRHGIHVGISYEPIEKLLSQPRVWVIDGAATTLQQLLVAQQGVVYVNTGGGKMMPSAQHLLRDAVEWLDGTTETMPFDLVAAVRRAEQGPRPASLEFVRQFVTGDVGPQAFADRVRAAVSIAAHQHAVA
jgi:hypothetical protein